MADRIPPLAALRAFAAVAHHGSFARAATALHVSTSAVSHQIRGLEASLGAMLLSRARNGTGHTRTAVTAEGEALLRAVEATFAQLATACAAVRERACGARPVLSISANGSVASLWLAPRLAAFAALHPSVQWQVRAIEEEPDMVREGLDLAILRARRGQRAEGDRLLFSETVFRSPVRTHLAAGSSYRSGAQSRPVPIAFEQSRSAHVTGTVAARPSHQARRTFQNNFAKLSGTPVMSRRYAVAGRASPSGQ